MTREFDGILVDQHPGGIVTRSNDTAILKDVLAAFDVMHGNGSSSAGGEVFCTYEAQATSAYV